MKALWLPSWYPNKISPYNGDFIKRHAEAVSLYEEIHVIYVVRDAKGAITKDILTEENLSGNLKETIIYYYSRKYPFFLDKYFSLKRYKSIYKQLILSLFEKNGKPDLVHLHVALKAGLIAVWIKKKFKIPFLLSEHWTGYLKEADERINDLNFFQRLLLKKIMDEAKKITVVSNYLGKAIVDHFPAITYGVVPNVVNRDIFFLKEKATVATTKFIHISNMNYQKNITAIIQAFQLLKDEQSNFELDLYGPLHADIIKMVADSGLTDKVFFKGEVPQFELAKALQNADALILYSRFETFGCVLIEANACGVPTIVSDIEVFHELIREGENGLFAGKEDPVMLTDKLKSFINENKFDKKKISETILKYKYEIVGKEFMKLYDSV